MFDYDTNITLCAFVNYMSSRIKKIVYCMLYDHLNIAVQNFPKIQNFKNFKKILNVHKISKFSKNFKMIKFSKSLKNFSFHKISKF